MSKTFTASFHNDYESALDASAAAEPFMESTATQRIRTLQIWVSFGLMACGVFAIADYLFDPLLGIATFFMLLGSVLISFGILISPKIGDRGAYKRFCETPFGSNAAVTINAEGFAYQTPNSNWLTGWGDVTEVLMTQNTLGIITPSLPFYVPNTAFDDPKAVFQAMQLSHKDAKA